MDNNMLTAQEARNISNTSKVTLKRIAKLVKEAANEGEISLNYCMESASGELVKSIVEELSTKGFVVKVTDRDYDEEILNFAKDLIAPVIQIKW